MSEKMYRIVNGETFEIPEDEAAEIRREHEEEARAKQAALDERDRKRKSLQDKLKLTDEEMLMILNH